MNPMLTDVGSVTAGDLTLELGPIYQAQPDPDRRDPGGVRAAPAGGARWERWYVAVLVALDLTALIAAGLVATAFRFGRLGVPLSGSTYLIYVVAASVPWTVCIGAAGGYAVRFLGLGGEEFRRVSDAILRAAALMAVLVYAFNVPVARGMVVVALPLAAGLVLVQRFVARRVLYRLRSSGTARHRVLVVGEGPELEHLESRLAASPQAGLRVVARCRPTHTGSLAHVPSLIASCGADTVAVAHCRSVTPVAMRQMAWALEGTGVDLLLAPALTDVAGPRVHVRPVSGLPLLQLSEPRFTGGRRLVKRTIDLIGALLLLTLLAPALLVVALLVRLTSPGPALFRQQRVGRDGKPFSLYKFRTMCPGAERMVAQLRADNDCDGVLFKLRDDPRVTRVGRWLRRYSVDELPQLVNVVRGQMSLVGPRPPLPDEVARYESEVYRRLLVLPGMTGLWQVSGRSALPWAEAVRLDLYYVENWSVALDLEILWRTASAVLRGTGAH